METNLTTTTSPPAARSLHEICEAARRGNCGPFSGALPGDECVFTTVPVSVPVTKDTPMQPARGYHVSRFAWAKSHGLISAAEFAAVTDAVGSFTPAMVIYDTIRAGAISGDRRVWARSRPRPRRCSRSGQRTGPLAPSPARPADRDAPRRRGRSRQWDREVARWLAELDVHTAGPRMGQPRWPRTRARFIVRAFADAIAYQTALTSGCPDCAEAAPEGCADHREDAARAAEYERALRCLVTWREGELRTPTLLRRPVPPSLGGAAHQLVITVTQDLRDVAVPCTCLRAAGLDRSACAAGGAARRGRHGWPTYRRTD